MTMYVCAWGLGKSGQLGSGREESSCLPLKVKHPRNVVDVSAGGLFTAFVSDGKVWTSGCGKFGRLGNGSETPSSIPLMIEVKDETFTKVSCGIWHGCGLTDGGKLFIWGYGKQHGVLGQTIDAVFSPPLPVLQTCKVNQVSCGNNFTLALSSEGRVYSWGCGRHGVLGQGDEEAREIPTQVQLDKSVTYVDAGFAHCGIVDADGRVHTFGKGRDGALGLGEKLTNALSPTLVPNVENIIALSCSVGEHHGHSLSVTADGMVFSWGDGYKGKLGHGDQKSRFVPTLIPQENFNGEKITLVSSGGIHSAAVGANGTVFTWGCGSDGRLGHPEAQGHRYLFRSDTPKVVESLKNAKAVKICASYYHTVALMS